MEFIQIFALGLYIVVFIIVSVLLYRNLCLFLWRCQWFFYPFVNKIDWSIDLPRLRSTVKCIVFWDTLYVKHSAR